MSHSISSALRRVSKFACIMLSAVMFSAIAAQAQYRTSIGAVLRGANLIPMDPATGEKS